MKKNTENQPKASPMKNSNNTTTKSPMLDLPPSEFWARVEALKRALKKEIEARKVNKSTDK